MTINQYPSQNTPESLQSANPVKITDGASSLTIKPASTPPLATDPSLVVAISPNTPIASSSTSDISLTTTPGTALNNDLITGDFSQYKTLKVNITGTFVATWTVQFANEPTFASPTTATIYLPSTGQTASGTGTSPTSFTVSNFQGRYVRVRLTAFTSGTVNSTISGSQSELASASSSGGGSIQTGQVVKVDRSGTIATGGTAQNLMAVNASRGGYEITNKSASVLFINESVTATGGVSDYPIQPGETYRPSYFMTGVISIWGATTGQAWEAKEWNVAGTSQAIFVQGGTPTGQNTSALSYPVALPSNSTIDIDKTWLVKTATGTPTANAGEILLQILRLNSGSLQTTWINLSTNVLLTVAPAIANLNLLSNTNQNKPQQLNGKQTWSLSSSGTSMSAAGLLTVAAVRTNIDGVNTALGSSTTLYTVPATKRLRILRIDFNNVVNATLAANTRGFVDFNLQQSLVAPTTLDTVVVGFRGEQFNNSSTAAPTGFNSGCFAYPHHFEDGLIDLSANTNLSIAVTSSSTFVSMRLAMHGYLYNS